MINAVIKKALVAGAVICIILTGGNLVFAKDNGFPLEVRFSMKKSPSFFIKSSKPVPYTAYRLLQPASVVIDLTDGYFTKEGRFKVRSQGIQYVELKNIKRNTYFSAQMIIVMSTPLDYVIDRKGNILVVKLRRIPPAVTLDGGPGLAQEEEVIEIAEAEDVEEEFEEAETLGEEIPESPEEVTEEAAPVAGEEVGEEGVAAEEVTEEAVQEVTEEVPAEEVKEKVTAPEEAPALARATKILDVKTSVEGGLTVIEIIGNGPIGDYNAFKLEGPTRIVVDIRDVGNLFPSNEIPVNTPVISKVRIGQHPDKLRLVMDVQEGVEPAFEVQRIDNKLVLRVGEGIKEEKTIEVAQAPPAEEEVPAEAVTEEAALPETAPEAVTKAPEEVTEELAEEVPPEVEETTAEAKPEVVEEKAAPAAPVAVPPKAEAKAQVAPQPAPAPAAAATLPTSTLKKRSKLIRRGEKPYFVFEPEELGMQKVYKGRKISLVFKDADIRDVLRVIAEVSNMNIIAGDDVKGTITIRLINVPWDQALDIILQSQGLGMVKIGNIIRIAPLDRLQKERERISEAKRSLEKVQDLITKLIPVNYASAKEMEAKVKKLLSDRGSLEVDERTNTVIIKDVPAVVAEAEKLIESLDLQTPQVLISARIVEVQDRYTRELGIQWGGGFESSPRYGNSTGLFFPNTINMFGTVPQGAGGGGGGGGGGAGGGGAGAMAVGVPQNLFAVNLPAAVGMGTGGAIGFVLGSINNSAILDLRLSALESTGKGKVISSPKILTLDNREAEIKQGISIPYETVSQSGTQTQFVDATLSLKVTPHITADRSVIMKIKIAKNAPNEALRSAGGVPSIDKKEARTEILVRDGETAVIGGIYKIDKSESLSGVPLLSRIPLIGWLFRKKARADSKTELLVFITPKIVVRR